MRKQSGFGVIEVVVAVVVIAVLAAAAYLFIQGSNKQQQETDNSSTESASMADHENMSDEDHMAMMADWKTFTSDKYDFSFQYPEGWTVTESADTSFPDKSNVVVKNAAGAEVLGVYGYLGTGCEAAPIGNEPTETLTVGSTEVTVTKNCNANWSWITAEAGDGTSLTVTTWSFLGKADEEDARMLLESVKGLSHVMAHEVGAESM